MGKNKKNKKKAKFRPLSESSTFLSRSPELRKEAKDSFGKRDFKNLRDKCGRQYAIIVIVQFFENEVSKGYSKDEMMEISVRQRIRAYLQTRPLSKEQCGQVERNFKELYVIRNECSHCEDWEKLGHDVRREKWRSFRRLVISIAEFVPINT